MSHPQTTFKNTVFHGKSILSVRRHTVAKTTVYTQLDLLRSTGRYDCFKLKWHPVYDDKTGFGWPVPKHLFWDSDIGKWIETACYFLQEEYDEKIDQAVQELVQMIRGAQGDDGYLNLHYTVVEPEPSKRWSNLRDMHELYNAGHLIEAALSHHAYYKNTQLLEPMLKYVSYIRKTFGPGEEQRHGYPGHPEIELALLRLYSATGSLEAYELARYFLEERGNPTGQDGKHYYDWESEQRGDSPWKRPNPYPESRAFWYAQAHQPILEQQSVEGHSVRCMYLLTAVADMVCLDLDRQDSRHNTLPPLDTEAWKTAAVRQWNNMVDKKMYLTGGIGAIKQWEGFGIDYFLPQGTDEGGCYAETCASIAVMMLAERLLHLGGESGPDRRYADVMELSLYNNVMTAMSLDGNAFTYVNQMASSEKDASARFEWFECACCPPNLSRLFGSLGGYLWDYGSTGRHAFVNVHLYTTARLSFDVEGQPFTLEQTSNWPWEGTVAFRVEAPSAVSATIRLRLPAWTNDQYTLQPEPSTGDVHISEGGYMTLSPAYVAANPSFTIKMQGFEPRYLAPHPYTNQPTLTLARGPVIYCAEDVDNAWEGNHFKDVAMSRNGAVTEVPRVDERSGEEYVELRTTSWRRSLPHSTESEGPAFDTTKVVFEEANELVLVPYYFRANRGGNGHMRVGMLEHSH